MNQTFLCWFDVYRGLNDGWLFDRICSRWRQFWWLFWRDCAFIDTQIFIYSWIKQLFIHSMNDGQFYTDSFIQNQWPIWKIVLRFVWILWVWNDSARTYNDDARTSIYIYILSYRIINWYVWCDVMWCDVMWCDVMWCDINQLLFTCISICWFYVDQWSFDHLCKI
jgi:hypothetical protein